MYLTFFRYLNRTQKAVDPSEESKRDHPAWIVKCNFKDFRATWRYLVNILLIYSLYSQCRSKCNISGGGGTLVLEA